MQNTKTAIVWFTNNLRVHDNAALNHATKHYQNVVGVYCFDKTLFETTQFGFKKIGKYRTKFLIESVVNLSENLKSLNIPLHVYRDTADNCIPKCCEIHNTDALLFQREFTQEENDNITSVISKLPNTIDCLSFYDQFLFHPDDIPFKIESLPEVFTQFRKRLEKYCDVRNVTETAQAKPKSNYSNPDTKIPTLKNLGFSTFSTPKHSAFPFEGGESSALDRLNSYFYDSKKVSYYKKTRNGLLGTDYSSKFSSWLANGSISAKRIYWELKSYEAKYGSNQSTYWLFFELIWRDYFKYLSLKHRNNLFKLGGIKLTNYSWKDNKVLIQKWIDGETKEPFINANMIELKQTGWMSNRGRQNVASYFAKELLLDWRIGAAYFESLLIDYDVHSNYGNWQYVAGVGNDPRDRKFNIKSQAERYDANGGFQRLWLQPKLF